MPEPIHENECPLCGHTGPPQVSTREVESLSPRRRERPVLMLLKCEACGTVIAQNAQETSVRAAS
jgi:hypothetical protein